MTELMDEGKTDRTLRHVAVYVTNHGFGHINRVVAVLNELPTEVRVSVRADIEVHAALQERLKRPIEFGVFPSDRGTVSPPGQNNRTDIPATFESLERRFEDIQAAGEAEIAWLRTSGVHVVYADASPLPMRLAVDAGVPCYLLANFTWDEIYADLLSRTAPETFAEERRIRYAAIIQEMKEACSGATLLRCWPHTPMLGIGRTVLDVGMVVNKAHDIRGELRREFDLPKETKLVYFYVGRYGIEALPWERLAEYPVEFVFVGFHPPGRELPGRFLTIDPQRYNGADLLRSSDAAIVKAGYGAVAEAMAAGTPVIYPPREGFIEFDSLDEALRGWTGGFPVSESDFQTLNLRAVLETAVKSRATAPDVPVNGSAIVARLLAESSD